MDYSAFQSLEINKLTKVYLGEIQIKNPALWWPFGMGQQNLYELNVEMLKGNDTFFSKTSKIGIRKAELVQQPIDCIEPDENCKGKDAGRSFFFKINEKEVYMKGANMVPIDYYPNRMKSESELKWLLFSAQAANINVLRIWGGGMYLDDNFYELADQAGMMIWHDMMFSCKIYPVHSKQFVENSKIEVREQTGRLQHHSSIVFWDLNNEGEDQAYWGDPGNWTIY